MEWQLILSIAVIIVYIIYLFIMGILIIIGKKSIRVKETVREKKKYAKVCGYTSCVGSIGLLLNLLAISSGNNIFMNIAIGLLIITGATGFITLTILRQ